MINTRIIEVEMKDIDNFVDMVSVVDEYISTHNTYDEILKAKRRKIISKEEVEHFALCIAHIKDYKIECEVQNMCYDMELFSTDIPYSVIYSYKETWYFLYKIGFKVKRRVPADVVYLVNSDDYLKR